MREALKKLFRWIFKDELDSLELMQSKLKTLQFRSNQLIAEQNKIVSTLKNTVGNIEVSADIDESPYAKSWAVISVQGRHDYIKFIDLGLSDLHEIQMFLRRFDRHKIDASPMTTKFLKMNLKG